jgi:hypothetical protein
MDAWQESVRSYLAQQAKIREFDGRLSKRDGIKVQLDDVLRKLTKLEGSDHAAILKRFQVSKQQDHEVTHTFNDADEVKHDIATLVPNLTLDEVRSGVFDDVADADVLSVITQLKSEVTAAQAAIGVAGRQLTERIDALRSHPGMVAWRARLAEAREAYEQLQAELAKLGITDLSVYGGLVQQRQALQQQLTQLDAVAQEKAAMQTKAQGQLAEVHAARARITAARAAFLTNHVTGNDYVRIAIVPGGEEVGSAERRLRDLIDVPDTRFASDIFQVEPDRPDAASGLLAEWERADDQRKSEANIRAAFAQAALGQRMPSMGGALCNNLKARADKDPAFVDRIRCFSFEDGLRVEASRQGDGRDFRPIEQASAGQRSAAMLAFLLSYGNEPIVLDQPEDDLDNHMIYTLIVRQIRENKLRRQLIIVTHNPNIVVNGDAELVHALDFKAGQCRASVVGALQETTVREEVCHIMEGGQEAFRRRWQRLGTTR